MYSPEAKEFEDHSEYESPFTFRYRSSAEMLHLFSERHKIETWRKLWIWLAEAQAELGLTFSTEQIDNLRQNLSRIDWQYASVMEREKRHDVMAHIETLKKVCPSAGGVLHRGATSAFVQDNADLIIMKEAMEMIAVKVARCIDRLSNFAQKYAKLPTVGRTHYQPASLTTVGKRACIWIQELLIALKRLEIELGLLRFRGVKGATGSRDSFLKLFEGDKEKVKKLNELVTQKAGFDKSFLITGQTYSRLQDTAVLIPLSLLAAAVHKICMDIRMLQSYREIQEPFEETQTGSSAMPWKKNPMRCERCCGLARFLMNLPPNMLQTAAMQGFERTLDDSSNRRLVLPEAFLTADAFLTTFQNITEGLIVHEQEIRANIDAEMMSIIMETVLMELVKSGKDRQEAHEKLRNIVFSANRVPSTIAQSLKNDAYFDGIRDKLDALTNPDPMKYIGLSIEDVGMFIREEVALALDNEKYKHQLNGISELRV